MEVVHAALNSVIYTQPVGGGGLSVEGFTNLTIDYAGSGIGGRHDPARQHARCIGRVRAYAFYPSSRSTGGDAYFGNSGRRRGRQPRLSHDPARARPLARAEARAGDRRLRRAAGGVNSLRIQRHDLRTTSARGSPATLRDLGCAADVHDAGHRGAAAHVRRRLPANAGNTTYTWNPLTGATFIDGDLAIQPGANRIFRRSGTATAPTPTTCRTTSTNLRIDLAPATTRPSRAPSAPYLGGGPTAATPAATCSMRCNTAATPRSLIENAIGGNGQRLDHRQPGEQRPERRQRQRHPARRRRRRHADRRQRQRRHRGPGRNRQRAGRGRQRPLRLQRRLRLSQHHRRRRQRRHLRLHRDRWRVQRRGDRDRPRRGLLRHRRHDDADRARERARVGQQRDDPRQRAGQQPAGQRRGRPDLRPAGQRQPVRRFRQRYAQRRPERRCHERRRGQRHLLRRQCR